MIFKLNYRIISKIFSSMCFLIFIIAFFFNLCLLNFSENCLCFITHHSVTGFNSAIVVKEIKDEEIDDKIKYMEDFVKNKLPKMLNVTEAGPREKYISCFFGPYSHDYKSFEFNEGEKILIKVIFKHVKEKVEADGASYFRTMKTKGKSVWSKTLMDTPYGLIFGNDDSKGRSKAEIKEIDVLVLKDQLLKSANSCLNKHKINHPEPKRTLSNDSINVSIGADGKVNGIVKCCYCTEDVGDVKVYCQEVNYKLYWIPSNFAKHLSNYHSSSSKLKATLEQLVYNDESGLSGDEQRKVKAPKRIKVEVDSNGNGSNIKCEDERPNHSLLSLEIVPNCEDEDVTALEDELFSQISKQNIQMINSTYANGEEVRDFISIVDPKTKEPIPKVKVCDMRADNCCLFAAITHQLFFMKNKSDAHLEAIQSLRECVVKHITDRLPDFIPVLKNRIRLRKASIENDDLIYKKCSEFVQKGLSSVNCWGGTESLKAISEMYKTNIIIINDDGKCNFAESYSPSNERSITIAFCALKCGIQKNNNSRNHYNSVAEINDQIISEYANELIQTYNKRIKGIKFIKEIQKSNIVFDVPMSPNHEMS